MKMPCPLLILSQSVYLIQVVDTNLNTEWQTVQIQISWLLQKPTDLDLHCLQRQGISGLSRTRVNIHENHDSLLIIYEKVCQLNILSGFFTVSLIQWLEIRVDTIGNN